MHTSLSLTQVLSNCLASVDIYIHRQGLDAYIHSKYDEVNVLSMNKVAIFFKHDKRAENEI